MTTSPEAPNGSKFITRTPLDFLVEKVDPTADLQVTTTVTTVDRGYQKVEGSACDEFGTIGSLWGGRSSWHAVSMSMLTAHCPAFK